MLTRNLPKSYQTRTEIFTGLASGPSVEAIGNTRMDLLATNNDFDNLINVMKSEETLNQVGEMLLTQHLMMDKPNLTVIGEDAWESFEKRVPKKMRDTLRVEGSEVLTLKKVKTCANSMATSTTYCKYLSAKVRPTATKPFPLFRRSEWEDRT